MIRWGSSSFRPSNGQRQGINGPRRQNILSPLEDRIPEGLVWGSQIVNVQKDEEVGPPPSPSQTPTLTPTQTSTVTPTLTPTQTTTPTPTPSSSLSDLTYLIYGEDKATRSTYTFSAVGYDGPGLIIVAVHGRDDDGAAGINYVNISGYSMTQIVSQQQGTSGSNNVALYAYRMTAGTSADIVINWTVPMERCSIGVWRLTGNSSDVPFDTDIAVSSSTSFGLSDTLNLNTGRNWVVAAFTTNGTNAITWTNATEKYDFGYSGENGRVSGASELFTSGATATISTSYSAQAQCVMCMAVWN
jgi:hypothetical protein